MDPQLYEKNGNIPVEEAKKRKIKNIEKEKLLQKFQERDKPDETNHSLEFRTSVLVISCISVSVTFIMGVATFVVAVLENSAASYGFAIDAILDCSSSIVVIWNFFSKDNILSVKKQFQAVITLAILFLLSFLSTFVKSLHDLLEKDRPSPNPILWIIAIVNTFACFLLFVAKFYLAFKTNNKSLWSDGLSSLIGFVLAIGLVIEGRVYENNHGVWWLDGSFGVICSFILMSYAISLFITSHTQWRRMSQSFENIEMEDPRPKPKLEEE